MQVFLIYRFSARNDALSLLKSIAAKTNVVLNPIVLDSSRGDEWKPAALAGITESEAVAIFDFSSCMQSENAAWEIAKARELNKPLILLKADAMDDDEIKKLRALYHHDEEFSSYFQTGGADTATLYKMMVDSSEQLIQRRQTMNAFFTTAIGSLLAIAGALAQFGTVKSPTISFLVMTGFGLVGLLLCNSWRNLIDNYGKLNAAKFRVILKLEQSLSAQIFSAEWAALGKDQRPQKYKSFTATENAVPLWFAILMFSLILIASFWHMWG
jgi:hypothetical protein